MTQPTPARRRFAPVPVETTFKEHRRAGPTSEPTPEPSPTSESPPPMSHPKVVYHETQTQTQPREKRRFAPRLLESSRRSRRAGDVGPATRPTDKTDITPYAKHIYSLSKKKHTRRPGHARRESCDDEIADHVFDLNKLEAQKRLEEVAMMAFPNSTMRLGGAEHFIMREGSGDDDNSSSDEPRGRAEARGAGDKKKIRRDSSEENVNWMVKEMQKHADQLAADRGDLDESGSASGRSEGPPDNTFDFTNKARHSLEPMSPIGEHPMPYIPSEPRGLHLTTKSSEPSYFGGVATYNAQAPPSRPIGESHIDTEMPDAAPPPRPTALATQLPPETGFSRTRAPFGRFYGFPNQAQDKAAEKAFFRLQTRRSPPMAGKDLTFRMCPSPKQTKLDPEQKWDTFTGGPVEPNRDITGQHGLWRGYCFTQNKGSEALAPSRRPAMIVTPMTPATPFEHNDENTATNGTTGPYTVSAEPMPLASATSEHRSRAGQPKGLHMLMGLEQRLQKEKVAADLDERIAAEFTDQFVTQVYNYLSLGYPATARVYDEELSKISRIPTDELEKEDEAVMGGVGSRAKGHIKFSMDLDMSEDKRCPRWKALKQYIFEWARQHPNLDSITPLAWGVAERRGSWGI